MGFSVVTVKLLLCLALTAAHLPQESDWKLLRKTARTNQGGPFNKISGDRYEYQCSCQKVIKQLSKQLKTPSGIKPHLSEEELIRDAVQAKLNRKSRIEEIENRNSELVEIEEGILDVPVVLTYQYPVQGDNVLVSVLPVSREYAGLYHSSFEDRPVLDYFDWSVAQPSNVYYQHEAPTAEEVIVDGPDGSILNTQNIAIVVNKHPIKKDTPKVFVNQPQVKTHSITKSHPKGTKQKPVKEHQHHNHKPTNETSPKPDSTVDAKHHESKPKSPNHFTIYSKPSTPEQPTHKKQEYHDHHIQPHRKDSGKSHYTKQSSQPERKASDKGHFHEKQRKESEGHESPQPKDKRKKGGKWAFTPGQQEHQQGEQKKPTHTRQEKYVIQPAHSHNQASGKGQSSQKPDQQHMNASGSHQPKGNKKKGGKWIYSPGQQVYENGVHKKPVHKNQGGGEHQQPVHQKHGNYVHEKQPTHSHEKSLGKGHFSQQPAHGHEKASSNGHSNEEYPKRNGGGHVEKHESHPKGKKKKKGGKWIYSPGQQVYENGVHKKPVQKNQGGGKHQQPVHQNHSHEKSPGKGHFSQQPAHAHEKAPSNGHSNEENPKRNGGGRVEKPESHPKGKKKKKGGKWIFTPGQQEVQKSAHDKHPKGKAKGQGEHDQGHHANKYGKRHGHGKGHEKKGGHEVKHQSGHNKHLKKQADDHGHQQAHGPHSTHLKEQKKKDHGVKHHPTKGKGEGHGQVQQGKEHGARKKEQKKKAHGVKHHPTKGKGEGHGQVQQGKGHGVSSHKKHGNQPAGKTKGHGKVHDIKHGARYEKHPNGKSEGHGKYVQGHHGQTKNHTKGHDKHSKKIAQGHGAKDSHRGNGHRDVGKNHSKDHGKNVHGAKHESGYKKQGHPKKQGEHVAQSHKAPLKGQGGTDTSGKSVKSPAKGKSQGESQYSESYEEEPYEVIKATPGKWTWQETDEEEVEDVGSQGESWSWSSEDSSDNAADDGGSSSWSWSSEDGDDSAAKSDASGSNKGHSGGSKSSS